VGKLGLLRPAPAEKVSALTRKAFVLAAAGVVLAAMPASARRASAQPAAGSDAVTKVPAALTLRATVNLGSLAAGSTTSGSSGQNESLRVIPAKPLRSAPQAPLQPPSPPLTPRASGQLSGFRQWDGLSVRDQALANGGQQFSSEPPDQGLCVGAGFVVEAVNDAINVYSSTGSQLLAAPVTENAFNDFPPRITRKGPQSGGGPPFGPFISDPKCYFDTSSGRWFHSVLEIDVNPDTGAFLNSSHEELAVTKTGDPLGDWNIYELDSTDASHPTCPCFGDQPLLGADAYGVYLSTAEGSLSLLTGGSGFNGPQLYGFSKSTLTSGAATVSGVQFSDLHHNEPSGCYQSGTLQPAFSPQGIYATGNQGTEFLLSGRETIPCDPLGSGNPAAQTSITVWALTNTSKLGTNPLMLSLTVQDVGTELYVGPPPQTQKDGTRPLGQALQEPVPLVQAVDDRINQVVYAAGRLWAGVNTRIGPGNRVGIAWFIVTPGVSGGQVTASLTNQGYVNVSNANVSFPSIGVNAAGSGILTFSLMGPDDYPSHAYTPITVSGNGNVYTAAAGERPEDGLTCYPEYGVGPPCRWGDYSAAVADPSGSRFWFAAEYVPKEQRTHLANWGTSIASVTP
jgi:hypothetical protein